MEELSFEYNITNKLQINIDKETGKKLFTKEKVVNYFPNEFKKGE